MDLRWEQYIFPEPPGNSSNSAVENISAKGKGNSYKYKVDAAVPVAGADCSAWTDWNGTADITAATGKTLVIVEVDGNGLAVKAGSVTVTAKA